MTSAPKRKAHAKARGAPRAPPLGHLVPEQQLSLSAQRTETAAKAAGKQSAQRSQTCWAAAAARLPVAAKYTPSDVASPPRDLAGSVLVAPRDRIEWFLALGELMGLIDEATRRHATALRLSPMPTSMPVAYIAQRLDYDDPLWGWQVRDASTGWLTGFITLTT